VSFSILDLSEHHTAGGEVHNGEWSMACWGRGGSVVAWEFLLEELGGHVIVPVLQVKPTVRPWLGDWDEQCWVSCGGEHGCVPHVRECGVREGMLEAPPAQVVAEIVIHCAALTMMDEPDILAPPGHPRVPEHANLREELLAQALPGPCRNQAQLAQACRPEPARDQLQSLKEVHLCSGAHHDVWIILVRAHIRPLHPTAPEEVIPVNCVAADRGHHREEWILLPECIARLEKTLDQVHVTRAERELVVHDCTKA